MSLVVVESESGSVDSDDVSDSLDDWEIFESLGVENEGGIVAGVTGSLLVLDVEGWINDLEGADVSIRAGLVWESSINDSSIEVLWLSRGKGSLGKLNIFVLYSNLNSNCKFLPFVLLLSFWWHLRPWREL